MSQQFPRERIRIEVDVTAKSGSSALQDQITHSNPDMWKATAVQFELGFFFGDELLDISDLQTITVSAKLNDVRNGPTLFTSSIGSAAFNTALTVDDWNNMVSQHAVVVFTATQTDVQMNNQQSVDLFVILSALNLDNETVVLGSTRLSIYETGVTGNQNNPPAVNGANIIPPGSIYNGSGHFTQAVTSGQIYDLALGGVHDTSLTNGVQTVTAGHFTAAGSSVVLNGTIGATVTSILRSAIVPTYDEVKALMSGYMLLIMQPGQMITLQSPNGRYQRKIGIDDNGDQFSEPIDLQA